jgi:hypothetical protein
MTRTAGGNVPLGLAEIPQRGEGEPNANKGGRTCACNAGARSHRCHKTKQSKGWNVTQPLPGWHQWTTPSGRSYTQGPLRYPAVRQITARLWLLGAGPAASR